MHFPIAGDHRTTHSQPRAFCPAGKAAKISRAAS
jgi:hypothetical protein